MKRPFLFLIFSGLILILVFLGLKIKQASGSLPVLGEVGSFELTDSNAQLFSEKNLKNKIWVADFIFTRCQGPCPRMTQKMQNLQRRFSKNDSVQLVTVTVDPEYDNPEILRQYAEKHLADAKKWHFLTGDRQKIESLMFERFKLGFAEDIMFHSDRLVLVDHDMKIRGYYSGSDKKDFSRLERDLRKIL